MRVPSRSLLAAVLLTAACAGTANAGPADISVCLPAGCVSTFDGGGAVSLRGVCLPEAVAALCTVDAVLGGGPITAHTSAHPWQASCSWSGSPGSRVDYGGTLVPTPTPGVTVTSMDFTCGFYVNGTFRSSTDGVPWNGELWAHRTDVSTARGDNVLACVLSASIHWSDGTSDSMATC